MNKNLFFELSYEESSDKYTKERSLTSWIKDCLMRSSRLLKKHVLFLVGADGQESTLVIIVKKSRRHYESAHCALEMFCGNRLMNRNLLQARRRAMAPGHRYWAMSNALLHSAKHIGSMNCSYK